MTDPAPPLPPTPQTAFLAAVIDALKADPAVAALCADRVYDEIPEDDRGNATVAFPYLYAGPIGWQDVDMGAGRALTVRARFYACSTAFDRSEAWALAEAAVRALNRTVPALAAPFACTDLIRAVAGGDVVSPTNPKAAYVDLTATVVGPA